RYINLYAYHLPLDAHPTLGNNAQLAGLLGIKPLGNIEPLLPYGEFKKSVNAIVFHKRLEELLGREVIHCGDPSVVNVKKLAWCTGGGQGYIQQAAEFGVDAFISGEISEQTTHIAREMGLNFYAAGHHATERYGIKALGEWLAEHHQCDVTFIDLPNPA
ncbi:dinuclear metal center protein, YbgI/SA1388 family, partial [Candidatus Regiella insecticola 5.15]